jgi:catechol 2,3-dioxygenase-like lactoylglutathione lyase family enzyme
MSDALVEALDHIVLTVTDVEATARFYTQVLGMAVARSEGDRVALKFGVQKINLHPAAEPYEPHATVARPGTGDVCFVSTVDLSEIVRSVEAAAVPIELGPIERSGARGPMDSIYFRDLDGNLIEIARYR